MAKKKKASKNTAPNATAQTKRSDSSKRMVIQPAIAKRWMEKNDHNRKIVKKHLERLKKVFEAGEFSPPGKDQVTGETIKFDKNGQLLDGQHRLVACYETGISFETYVVFGLNPKVFPKIDQGAVRTTAHILGIEDPKTGESFKDARTVAAAITAYHGITTAIESGAMPKTVGWTLAQRVEASDARKFALKHKALLIESVTTVRGPEARTVLRPAGTFAAVYFLLAQKNHNRAREFFNALGAGTGLTASSPIYKLRQLLITSIGDKSRTAPWKVAVTIKAWNAWLGHKEMRQLRFGESEAFPKPRKRG
jgi:hypothetical protein